MKIKKQFSLRKNDLVLKKKTRCRCCFVSHVVSLCEVSDFGGEGGGRWEGC